MKCKIFISKDREEEVLIYSHERTKLVDEIEKLIENDAKELVGYIEREAYKIKFTEVYCFTAENNNVYAVTDKGRLRMRLRLYQIEEMLDGSFIKINQSCIANIKEIERFDTSLSGTLRVIFKNGITDYVSRRNIKSVKERLGVK